MNIAALPATILNDVYMKNWTEDSYHELLGTELGDQVLAIAGEHQDAAVFDNDDATPPVPSTPVVVVAPLGT